VIGLVVRTRAGVNPVYVSVGHRIALADAAEWVLRLCGGYRLPEPARLAHQAAGGQAIAVAPQPAGEQMSLF
jgi:deoxyribonuclease V